MTRPTPADPYNIAAHRHALGLSQSDLAARSGVTRSAIAQYENRGIKPPEHKLAAIARALGMTTLEMTTAPTDLPRDAPAFKPADLSTAALALGRTVWIYAIHRPITPRIVDAPGYFNAAAGMFHPGDVVLATSPSGACWRVVTGVLPDAVTVARFEV